MGGERGWVNTGNDCPKSLLHLVHLIEIDQVQWQICHLVSLLRAQGSQETLTNKGRTRTAPLRFATQIDGQLCQFVALLEAQ